MIVATAPPVLFTTIVLVEVVPPRLTFTIDGFGNVVIVTNDGKRLTSPQLKYMQGLNEVSSDTSFVLVQPGKTIEGIGLKADPQLTHVQILKNLGAKSSFMLPGQ